MKCCDSVLPSRRLPRPVGARNDSSRIFRRKITRFLPFSDGFSPKIQGRVMTLPNRRRMKFALHRAFPLECGGGKSSSLSRHGQIAIGTVKVERWEKPVAQYVFLSFLRYPFTISGSLVIIIDINIFFEQILYKVYGFQWTNRKICCIIISFLCRGLRR